MLYVIFKTCVGVLISEIHNIIITSEVHRNARVNVMSDNEFERELYRGSAITVFIT